MKLLVVLSHPPYDGTDVIWNAILLIDTAIKVLCFSFNCFNNWNTPSIQNANKVRVVIEFKGSNF